MFDAIKSDNARYALFALANLATEEREASDVARVDARMTLRTTETDQGATVRPSKGIK